MSDNRLSVAQLVDALRVGGLERVAVNLANGLADRGYDSHLIASRYLSSLASAVDPKVHLWCADRSARWDLAGIKRIVRYINEHRISIVHSHNSPSSYLARVVFRFTKSRPIHIVHDHHGAGVQDRKQAMLDWLMLRRVDAFVAVSQPLRDRAQRLLSLPPQRCLYLPNGITMPPVDVTAEAHQGCPTVVHVANVWEVKDHATAARAAAILRKKLPNLRWLCAGKIPDPPTRHLLELRELIRSLDLEDCFQLLGSIDDVFSIHRQANVGVQTSTAEGLPLSLLEYMASQLPLVVTDVGQGPALVLEAQAGLVVPTRSPEKLAEAILRIIEDPKLARQMGVNGRKLVEERFTADSMVRQVHELYQSLLSEES